MFKRLLQPGNLTRVHAALAEVGRSARGYAASGVLKRVFKGSIGQHAGDLLVRRAAQLSAALADLYAQTTSLQRLIDDERLQAVDSSRLIAGIKHLEQGLSSFLHAATCDLSVALALRRSQAVTSDALEAPELRASLLLVGATPETEGLVRVVARSWGEPLRTYAVEEIPFPLAEVALRGCIPEGFRAEPDILEWLPRAPPRFQERWRQDPLVRKRYQAAIVCKVSRPDEHLGDTVKPWLGRRPEEPIAVLCIESGIAGLWRSDDNSILAAILAPYLTTIRLVAAVYGQAAVRAAGLEHHGDR